MSSAVDVLKARWERLCLANEAGWLVWLLLGLGTGAFGIIYPLRNESLGQLVEIPPSLAAYLNGRDIDLNMGAAYLGGDHIGPSSYQLFNIMICCSVCIAALRGRWYLYFACLAAMLIPASWLGTVRGDLGAIAIFAGILAAGRSLFTRQYKPILIRSGVAVAIAILCGVTVLPSRGGNLVIHRKPEAAERASDQRLFGALDALPAEFQPQARYVRAQLAYIRRDWTTLKAIGPLDARKIEHTPFTARRLQVLRQTVLDLAHPDYTNPVGAITWWVHIALLVPLIVFSVVVSRLRRRIGKITRMQTDMDALPPLRHALRELQA